MTSLWSWDHCFNAIALSHGDPQAAWDQFMQPFDRQDAAGCLPDAMTDSSKVTLYVKPPIHGWALSKMMERMELSFGQMQEAYEKLSKWTGWWLQYRDNDGDGICEYWHGNDSGWDNSTAFSQPPPIETPDLAAFLVIQMDVLADLAGRLDLPEDASAWKRKADAMLAAMADHCYVDGEPVARRSGTHEIIPNDSLLLYTPVTMGSRMPESLLKRTVEVLKSAKFLTAHGLATESPDSPFYKPNGYWRGPIWAPSTMLIVDGLIRSGEKEFAAELARRFCDMATKSGFAENFDALTGDGLCDRAYTWTASVFLVLANLLLETAEKSTIED
jgi:glycogen debranching enzyme